MSRTIEDIVETLKSARKWGRKCSILIGAGCSASAGIPTARGFVEIIQKDYPRAYDRAEEKTYSQCMSELSRADQRDLIAEYVDKAKINWGHIALAQLMQAGFIDRVLTTNFDSLVVQASALLRRFPAVYDFAASQNFEPEKVPEQAIFYLHGQRTGFVLINTPSDFDKHSELLSPVFQDAGRGRTWLVIGYSGENDPVFDHLANVHHFDNSLYWIGYGENEPGSHLRERLLIEGKDTHYISGFNSDNFLVTLAQMLECFPPKMVSKPFSYLESIFDSLSPYTFSKTNAPVNVMKYARRFVHTAVEQIEGIQTDVLQAWADLLGGDYEKVVILKEKYQQEMHPEVAETIAWAFVMQGNTLYDQALTKNGLEADELFKQSYEKYDAALQIRSDDHDAFSNWGTALFAQAQTKNGVEADRIFKQSYEKYSVAVQIKSDFYEAFNNWGTALYAQAQTKSGAEADELFKQSYGKYATAVKIKPNDYETFNNWGTALYDQAQTKDGVEADELFKLSYEKFSIVVKIKSDDHKAFNNWGTALSAQAQTKSDVEADELFKLSYEKYEVAMKIKPDFHEALTNWGTALYAQAKTKSGVEANELFNQSNEKYAAVVQIKSDGNAVFNTWKTILSAQVQIKSGSERNEHYKQAYEKYQITDDNNTDSVTGLPNRRALDEQLQEAIRYAKRMTSSFSVVMMDLDAFGNVNDTYGYVVGDDILRSLFNYLAENKRATDFLARYGGDELTLIMRDTDQSVAELITQKIIELVKKYTPPITGIKDIKLSISAGVAMYPMHSKNAGDLLRAADAALYQAKKHFRGSYVIAKGATGPLHPISIPRRNE